MNMNISGLTGFLGSQEGYDAFSLVVGLGDRVALELLWFLLKKRSLFAAFKRTRKYNTYLFFGLSNTQDLSILSASGTDKVVGLC